MYRMQFHSADATGQQDLSFDHHNSQIDLY